MIRRAELQLSTRRRIVEAAVELHGTVGPARTTVSAIAERAGVERLTVYRHFPDEASMLAAACDLWMSVAPRPDPAAWRLADARARLRAGLLDVYGWYAGVDPPLACVLRDAPLVPGLASWHAGFEAWLSACTSALANAWSGPPGTARVVRVAVGHALAFDTWASLCHRGGLDRETAAGLMVEAVRAASTPRGGGWAAGWG